MKDRLIGPITQFFNCNLLEAAMEGTGYQNSALENPVLDILKNRLQVDYEQIAQFCQRFGIVSLGVFGSVLRDDFRASGENPSDVDLLIEFAPDQELTWPMWLDLQETSEKLFKRKVDLVRKHLLKNPYRRAEILKTNRIVYERK